MDDESGDDEEMIWQMNDEVNRDKTNEADKWIRLERRDDAYLNERPVIFNDEMVGEREKMTPDEYRSTCNVCHIIYGVTCLTNLQ